MHIWNIHFTSASTILEIQYKINFSYTICNATCVFTSKYLFFLNNPGIKVTTVSPTVYGTELLFKAQIFKTFPFFQISAVRGFHKRPGKVGLHLIQF